jgi:hypothetical protein
MFLYMMTFKQWCENLSYKNIFSIEFIMFMNYNSIDIFLVLLATKITAKYIFLMADIFTRPYILKYYALYITCMIFDLIIYSCVLDSI